MQTSKPTVTKVAVPTKAYFATVLGIMLFMTSSSYVVNRLRSNLVVSNYATCSPYNDLTLKCEVAVR